MAVTFFPTNPVVAQSIAQYNRGLSDQDIARVQAAVQEAAIREQAKANEAQRYFAAAQAAQDRDLQRQQLSQADYFNRGRLANDQAQIAANLKLAESNNAAQAAWHQAQLQPKIDQLTADKAAEAEQKALLVTQADNLAKARNEHASLTADLSKLAAMETAQAENSKLPNPPGMFARSGLRPDLYDPAQFKQEATTASGRSIGGVNFAPVKSRLQAWLKELEDYINSAPKGLEAMLARTPGWANTFRLNAPAPGVARPAYLNALTNTPTATVTNAPAPVSRGKVTPDVAIQYLQRTGGDKDAARRLAVSEGWEL